MPAFPECLIFDPNASEYLTNATRMPCPCVALGSNFSHSFERRPHVGKGDSNYKLAAHVLASSSVRFHVEAQRGLDKTCLTPVLAIFCFVSGCLPNCGGRNMGWAHAPCKFRIHTSCKMLTKMLASPKN